MDFMIWMDCEMTGLDPFRDRLLEISIAVTDWDLNILNQVEYVIAQPLEVLEAMDEWNTNQHSKSGLWAAVLKSSLTVESVEKHALTFLASLLPPQSAPLCGNSIHQDRFFLKKWMPTLEQYVHYRNVDVSTLKQTLPHWIPGLEPFEKAEGIHRAKSDILESIAEMQYYQRIFQGRLVQK